MDISALINLRPTGAGAKASGGDTPAAGGFQGTLEAALAKAAPGDQAATGLTLLGGGAGTGDDGKAMVTPPTTAPSPLPLGLLAGDAAAPLAPGQASEQATTGEGEAPTPAADADAPDGPAPEGLVALAGGPAPTPAPATASAGPDAPTLAGTRRDAGADPAAAALARQAASGNGEANGQPPAAGTRPAPLNSGEAPAAPAAPAMVEAQRTATRVPSGAEPATPTASPLSGPTASPAAASPATPTATVQTPVAASGWGQDLGQQVVSLARRGDQHMELHLNPRDLGPLSVSLKLDDHGAQAHFFSSHAPVRGAVEQAIPQLREALAQQGIALGEAMVGDQPRQQFNGESGDGQPNRTPALADTGDDATVTGAEPTRATTVLPTSGVDLYA